MKEPIKLRRSPLDGSKAILSVGTLRLRAAIGRTSTTVFKREGDGATPVASMRILSAWRRGLAASSFRSPLSTRRIRADDGWCDASGHPAYNRPVRLPFPASTETMHRGDHLYDQVVVLDWNVASRRRGRGSAIFLHLARDGFKPTEGCVALNRADMARLAPLLRRGRRIVVAR